MNLTEFLLARIAEDEGAARAATKPSGFYIYPDPTWHVVTDDPPIPAAEGHVEAGKNWVITGEHTEPTDRGPWSEPDEIPLEIAAHIARHDPARVLVDCDAKRRLVDLHKLVTEDYSKSWWARSLPNDPRPPMPPTTGCDSCRSAGVDGEEYLDDGPCPTLRLLALPYASHPDYDESWRPE